MKKLLFMVNDLHAGGSEKALISLLKELVSEELEITVMVLRKQGEFLSDVPVQVRVVEVDMPEELREEFLYGTGVLLKNALKNRNIYEICRLLREYLGRRGMNVEQIMKKKWQQCDRKILQNREQYDVAIDFQGQGAFPTYYVAKKIQALTKYSWIHNDYAIVTEKMEWIRSLYSCYKKICSVSEQAKKSFILKFPDMKDKACICYNVMRKEEILELAKEFLIEKEIGVNIVTVGRLSTQKGYDVALEVMERLNNEKIDFHYWIIGEGEERKKLEQMVETKKLENRVCFAGFQKNPYPYIAMCDIYLQPSRFEGFCLTVGEAKILKKNIITTDFAGASEQIQDGVNGIVTSCDEELIYKSLKMMIEDRNLRQRINKNLQCEQQIQKGLTQFKELIYLK